MARDFLDLIDLRLLKVGMVADPLGLVFGNTDLAELRLGLAGQNLDFLPNGVLVLEGEDVSHLRAGIAIDHSGSFLVIGTLVVTQPLYRAQVQVWAAGINLTFWNWSGQRDVRAPASRTRTGCGDLLGFTETMGETLLNWPSRGLPRSVERATGRPRICFANPHRLQAPVGAFACSLQTLRVCLTLAPCRVRVPALY